MTPETYDVTLARSIYSKTGECNHKQTFRAFVRPYKCNLTQEYCKICGKELGRVYDD